MILPDYTTTPGQHLGSSPKCPSQQAELDRVHALGWDTCMADWYSQLPPGFDLDTMREVLA